MYQQKLDSASQALIELIRDKLIQDLHKFPDLCGRGTNQYFSFQEYVLENGLPVELEPVYESDMPAQSCYANAEAIALSYPASMFYMEGYAAWKNPKTECVEVEQHAWVYHPNTNTHFDPTFLQPGVVALGCMFQPTMGRIATLRRTRPVEHALAEGELLRGLRLGSAFTIGNVNALSELKSVDSEQVFSKRLIAETKSIRMSGTLSENNARKLKRSKE